MASRQPPPQPRRSRRKVTLKDTPEQAVAAAQSAGEAVETVTGPDGQELLQRPLSVDLTKPPEPPPLEQGDRVLVFHKRRTTMHLTDCKIGPQETKLVLKTDAELPSVAPYIIKVAS